MSGTIRVGVGGWTFEPWRGVFYPKGLVQKRELAFASRALTTIEINGTFYSTFKPASWRNWRDETPDGFVFSVKASRFCTNRKVLASAGESVARFLEQGLTELGPRLGPINWQLAATKKFEHDDFAAFLELLPKKQDGVALRHAIEVRHASFLDPTVRKLAKKHRVAIVHLDDEEGIEDPAPEEPTAGFSYARLRVTTKKGITAAEVTAYAKRLKKWAAHGDVFAYFIAGEKVRNPAAAQALIAKL